VSAPGTIYALSSGSPPAAIAIVRVSGPDADAALQALSATLPPPRCASLVTLRRPADGEPLDRALVLRFPGPASATGEDLVELHLHGGRAVVAAVLAALSAIPRLRAAEAGEFTRRAFENGRIDLAEAEGLADLLAAETEGQRRSALFMAGGALSRTVQDWEARLDALAAALEAVLNFSDEGEVGEEWPGGWHQSLAALTGEMDTLLANPPAERLRGGIRVVIAGPPNAGKSSLLNALVQREAAITSPTPGTTRDIIEAPVSMSGIPFLFTDTAGLRESGDEVERIGVDLALRSAAAADILLWLGSPEEQPEGSVLVAAKADLPEQAEAAGDVRLSALTGEGMDPLVRLLLDRAAVLLPSESEVSLNARQRGAVAAAAAALATTQDEKEMLLAAESLRLARGELARVTGRSGVEDMLDALFGRFCIGK
jgi:tRNA modification GTPase